MPHQRGHFLDWERSEYLAEHYSFVNDIKWHCKQNALQGRSKSHRHLCFWKMTLCYTDCQDELGNPPIIIQPSHKRAWEKWQNNSLETTWASHTTGKLQFHSRWSWTPAYVQRTPSKLLQLLTAMKEEIHSTGNNIFLLQVFIKIFTFRVFSPLQYSGNILAGQSWLSPTSESGLYCSHKLVSNHTGSPQEFLPRGYSFRTSSRDLNCFLYGEKNNIAVIDWPFLRYVDIWRMLVHCENLGAGVAPEAPHIFKGTLPVIFNPLKQKCMAGKGWYIFKNLTVIQTQLYYLHQWFGSVTSQRQKTTGFTILVHPVKEKEQWKRGWMWESTKLRCFFGWGWRETHILQKSNNSPPKHC